MLGLQFTFLGIVGCQYFLQSFISRTFVVAYVRLGLTASVSTTGLTSEESSGKC